MNLQGNLLGFDVHNMADEVFTLSWDDFKNKCPKVFKDLWLDTDLSDVTLATEDDGRLSAHKVILAASSPLFKRLLQKNSNSHPLLYLMGVKLSQLQQLLSYIYLGQCGIFCKTTGMSHLILQWSLRKAKSMGHMI